MLDHGRRLWRLQPCRGAAEVAGGNVPQRVRCTLKAVTNLPSWVGGGAEDGCAERGDVGELKWLVEEADVAVDARLHDRLGHGAHHDLGDIAV